MKNGDFETIEGQPRLLQHIKVGLKILKGDWVLDYRQGVDYIGGLRAFSNKLKADIKNAIQTVWGVDKVLKYNFNDENEVYKVSGSVLSGNDEIFFEGSAGI